MSSSEPSYLKKIGPIISNLSDMIRILYIASDHPNILELLLDASKEDGSYWLRKWLSITAYDNFDDARRQYAARSFLDAYEDKTSYGRMLKTAKYSQSTQSPVKSTAYSLKNTDPVILEFKDDETKPVYYKTAENRYVRLTVSRANNTQDGESLEEFGSEIKRFQVSRDIIKIQLTNDNPPKSSPPVTEPVTLEFKGTKTNDIHYKTAGDQYACLTVVLSEKTQDERSKLGTECTKLDTEGMSFRAGEDIITLSCVDEIESTELPLTNKTTTIPTKPTDDFTGFFYLTNADALDITALSRMLQAFLSSSLYSHNKLVITGASRHIPEALADQIQLIQLGSPSSEDIKRTLTKKIESKRTDDTSAEHNALVEELAPMLTGLTHLQLENVLSHMDGYIMSKRDNVKKKLADAVRKQKNMENEKDGTLVITEIEEDPGVVGIGNFSSWLNQNLDDLAYPEKAATCGLAPPRGVILTGVPGTGKSQLAKQIAFRWSQHAKRPVSFIEFNIGRLSSSAYGASEAKMDKFLDRISEQEPAVLFIDEIEKTFFREDEKRQGMHEVKQQQMGRLLGWLQEHKENIFTFVTSNDISKLPPELIRSGRLSERFFVFMPNYTELMSMLYVFLRSTKKKAEKAENKIFSKEFEEEIDNKCKVIDDYTCGNADEEALRKAVSGGSLKDILTALTRYATHLEANEDPDWEKLFSEDTKAPMRTPFMTGADLRDLVNRTIQMLRQNKPLNKHPDGWTGEDFADAMKKCCCNDDFMPYGQSNLKALATLYRSCTYRDVSAKSLLPRGKFDAKTGHFKRDKDEPYIKDTQPDNLYDQYMQQALRREIEAAISHEEFDDLQRAFQRDQMERQRAQWEKEDEDAPA